MNKALVAAAVVALGFGTACQQDGSWPESEENTGSTTEGAEVVTKSPTMLTTANRLDPLAAAAVRKCMVGYNPLDHHLAALGTAVLKCKKSIGPDDFVIREHPADPKKGPVLQRNFQCDDRANQDIDNLLGLQLVEYARAVPYFNTAWENFLRRYKRAGSPECPQWEQLTEENAPSPDTVKQWTGFEGEVKSHNTWQLHPSSAASCQDPQCLVNTARLCTSWLGVRFWESGDPEKAVVRTDPSWWKDNTNYGNPDFFDTLGWVHRMATDSGWPPGDLYGAPARWGEMCTFYAPDMLTVVGGYLYPIQCSPGWYCATQCKLEAGLPVAAPVPAF